MANEAVYVALAILVIIITVMVWNRKVDTYSRIGGCQVKCQGKSGSNRNLCIQECLGHQIMRYGGQSCSNDDDCQSAQVCVLGGFYTGEAGSVFPSSNIGTCIDQSDPGVIEWERKRMSSHQRPHLSSRDRHDNEYAFSSNVEGYGYQSCPPGQYWNAYPKGCAKIFSGKSSAEYVRSQKPDFATEVDIPGTTLPMYGVGKKDPKDIPSGVFISSDIGYKKR